MRTKQWLRITVRLITERKSSLERMTLPNAPMELPGVEERMILLFSEGVMTGKISLEKLVEIACTQPSRIYGLYPKKGCLQPGADGDLLILDPSKEWVLTHSHMHSAVDYTAYEGMKIRGSIELVMQRGNIIVKDTIFWENRETAILFSENRFRCVNKEKPGAAAMKGWSGSAFGNLLGRKTAVV